MSLIGQVVGGIYLDEHEIRGTVVSESVAFESKVYLVELHHVLFIGERPMNRIVLEGAEIRSVLGPDSLFDESDPDMDRFDPYPPEEMDPSWIGYV